MAPKAKAKPLPKSKRITVEPKGISVRYKRCPTCATTRKGETPVLIDPAMDTCRLCYGIEWQREHVRKLKRRPKAKAKVSQLSRPSTKRKGVKR